MLVYQGGILLLSSFHRGSKITYFEQNTKLEYKLLIQKCIKSTPQIRKAFQQKVRYILQFYGHEILDKKIYKYMYTYIHVYIILVKSFIQFKEFFYQSFILWFDHDESQAHHLNQGFCKWKLPCIPLGLAQFFSRLHGFVFYPWRGSLHLVQLGQ